MAIAVSHAMRQFQTFSTYKDNNDYWPITEDLPMRYADPWLQGSIRAPSGVVLAPALVLCSCPDYVNGTKRSRKKSPSLCKRCKGTRLPVSPTEVNKYGTVRCYPTSVPVPISRPGTLRVASHSRPSVLPSSDPYNTLRASRFSFPDAESSPKSKYGTVGKKTKIEIDVGQKYGTTGRKSFSGNERYSRKSILPENKSNSTKYSTIGRKSILECDVNPYELMVNENKGDNGITMVNGQRIRVQPIQQSKTQNIQTSISENEYEYNNRCKSILKKPATFVDTDSSDEKTFPNTKSGSHFYLPVNSPRKKVQFLDENSNKSNKDNGTISVQNHSHANEVKKSESKIKNPPSNNITTLKRSNSERQTTKKVDVHFNDTMALRIPNTKHVAREIFTKIDPEILDGTSKNNKTLKPARHAPPPPPPAEKEKNEPTKKTQTKNLGHKNKKEVNKIENSLPNSLNIDENRDTLTIINEPKLIIENTNNLKLPENEPASTNNQSLLLFNTNNILEWKQTENKANSKLEASLHETPPAAPPRKRSNNKQPIVITNDSSTSQEFNSNKTIVRIVNDETHKLKIKNEFSIGPIVSNEKKTSILISGDDCYSTVNVNDDVPLYQSSVVVNDGNVNQIEIKYNKSSTVYITNDFNNENHSKDDDNHNKQSSFNSKITTTSENKIICNDEYYTMNSFDERKSDEKSPCNIKKLNEENVISNGIVIKSTKIDEENKESVVSKKASSDYLKRLLNDPVEAVRMNLVPHVCGKSDVLKKETNNYSSSLYDPILDIFNDSKNDILTKLQLLAFNDNKDNLSEHSYSTQYEIMDPGSDCYTDNSNRSSITEEELAARTKFYDLLSDTIPIEVSDGDDHHYESINKLVDPIYEEIEIPPPLPTNPPPPTLLDDLQIDKELTTRSIFEGASKYDILSYLVDAKERGLVPEDTYTFNFENIGLVVEEKANDLYQRMSNMSTVSDSSEDSPVITDEKSHQKSMIVERNDSGVGSETGKYPVTKFRNNESSQCCEDCEGVTDLLPETDLCKKCSKKRSERKEIIMEIVETEEKYSRDLQIILEEFYQPMHVAGLLTTEQLTCIFINVEELLENSQALAERLRDAVDIAYDQGDEDLLTVNIGKIFLEAAPMLHAFETYCVRQGAASLLLASLEKDKELLRIFLRVSQMENTVLRRMNLNSFLMVPVQRVTKYPLLLNRLYKVTPQHHETRELLKDAQHKIELHLNHMNSETKDVPSKLWRRISNNSVRRSSAEMDLVNIKLRKIAVDVLEWNHDEAKFALEGKLLFTQPTDNNWRRGRTIKLTPINALLVTNGKTSSTRPERENLIFSRHSGVRDAALLLVRDKNGRYSLLREPLYLDRCVIAADPAWQSYFEVQELLGKDTFIFKAEDEDQTRVWYRQLQYYAQGMGTWRKRRNALANIMINSMGLRS